MKKIRVAFYDTHSYDRNAFLEMNKWFQFDIEYFDFKLNEKTAAAAKGFDAVCIFVNDIADKKVISILKDSSVKLIALRCAGFNNVDMKACTESGIKVVRVPSYSPHAVAEHAVAMLLSLTRHLPQAYLRTKTGNFTLEGLTGRDLNGLTAGIIGTGKIGKTMAELLSAFGMKIVLYDPYRDQKWASEKNFQYTDLETLFKESDVISLHCLLSDDTFHVINEKAISLMKDNVVLINTGRGALIDTKALVNALKKEKIGGAALDVYEEESRYFFNDWSAQTITDDVLARLLTFPNVLVTSHQAFLTENALNAIARTTLENIRDVMENLNELESATSIQSVGVLNPQRE